MSPEKQKLTTFNNLVIEHQDRVFNTCYGFLNNREDAEDIAQQTFIKAWNSLGSFRGEASITTWLYKIAVRCSIDEIRKRKSRERWLAILAWFGMKACQKPDNMKRDPSGTFEENEKNELLWKTIAELPEKQRIACILANFEGLKCQEIAEIMETSLSAVESLLFRARNNLRTKLKSFFEDSYSEPEENPLKEAP